MWMGLPSPTCPSSGSCCCCHSSCCPCTATSTALSSSGLGWWGSPLFRLCRATRRATTRCRSSCSSCSCPCRRSPRRPCSVACGRSRCCWLDLLPCPYPGLGVHDNLLLNVLVLKAHWRSATKDAEQVSLHTCNELPQPEQQQQRAAARGNVFEGGLCLGHHWNQILELL